MKKLSILVVLMVTSLPVILRAQTCGTTNIALNKPVTVSAEIEWHTGADAVDGNVASGWYAPGDTNYIYVDLLQSYTICKVKIYWNSNGRGKNYKIQVSTDAQNWTDIFARTNNSNLTDSMDVNGTGRYLRVYTTEKVNFWSNLEIQELRIYNSMAGNQKPSVALTQPAHQATFVAGENITLNADAVDPDGSVVKVEFYSDTTKIGEDFTAPYTMTWANVPAGTYTLHAKALDNNNDDSTSLPSTITVNASGGWSLTGNTGTWNNIHFLGTTDSVALQFRTNNTEKMTILPDGFVGINTNAAPDPEAKLGVNGAIYTTKLKVTQTNWADYVFNNGYQLPALRDVESYIKKYKHLPGVPAAADVIGKPVDVAQIQELLLKKIEELTLYVIEQQKQIETLKRQLQEKNRK